MVRFLLFHFRVFRFFFCRYVSCGPTRGNAFGLAAVCGVCFPFFFFARLYAPIPPMTNGLYFVTVCLVSQLVLGRFLSNYKNNVEQVIGYSYQDVHFSLPGSPGFGWTIAWVRSFQRKA